MKPLLSLTFYIALSLAVACGGGSKDADTVPAAADTSGDTADTADTGGDTGDTGDTADTDESGEGGGAAEQAAEGATVWSDGCAMCHGNAGEGKGKKNPAVVGAGTLSNFANAAALYGFIKEKMPKDDPGNLSDPEAWAVTAWILDKNGKLGADALSDENAESVSVK